MANMQAPDIHEASFEYRADLGSPLFEAWTPPNKAVTVLVPVLKQWGVTLGDVTWNRENNSAKDLQVTFNVQKLGAVLKVGLDSLVFNAFNPDWAKAPQLLELFQTCTSVLEAAVGLQIARQEAVLAFHVTPGARPFKEVMRELVRSDKLGVGNMYGLGVYESDSSFIIDRSLRFDGGAFVRLQRAFAGSVTFDELAKMLYDDEIRVLKLLELSELLPK
ncbi:MAG TPA: hypothetical protein VII95_14780 [Terriglobales bacterium]|jgi:hypothetical protein